MRKTPKQGPNLNPEVKSELVRKLLQIGTIDILGHKYTFNVYDNDEDQDSLGTCSITKCNINLNLTQCDSQLIDTVFHELIEAYNYHLSLKLQHRNIQVLGTCLLHLIKSNKELIKLFLDDEDKYEE